MQQEQSELPHPPTDSPRHDETLSHDVVIIGAGMVGAALAARLGRAGFRIGLVDRQAPPSQIPEQAPGLRVSALSAGSEALLRNLGAWQHIETLRLCPYRRLAVWEQTDERFPSWLPEGFNRTQFSAADVGCDHLGHIVENNVTQMALWKCLDQMQAVDRIVPASITGIEIGPDRVQVALDSGRRLVSPLLIGADGAGSRVRELAHMGLFRSQYRQQCLVATVAYQGAQEDITWQAFTPEGPRAFLPLPDLNGRSWASLVWYDQPDRVQDLKALPEADFIAQLTRHFPAELPPVEAVAARASFPLFRGHARRYYRPRVVLAGDAAHTINPLAGQGVNLGFQDVDALAEVLCQARDSGRDWGDSRVLAGYEQRRRPANERMMAAMDLFYHSFSNRQGPLYLARNLGLAMAGRLPLLRREVTRYAMGLDQGLSAPVLKVLDRLPLPSLPMIW